MREEDLVGKSLGWSRIVSGVAVLGTLNGCLPAVSEQHVETSRPSATEPPVKTISKREPEPTIKTEVAGNLVNVVVEQPTECRETLRSPMKQEIGTERSLQNGVLAQGINLAAAGLLVAGGVALYSAAGLGTCTKTPQPTAQNQNPASRPCTVEEEDQERRTDKTAGIVITSLAAIPVGLFIWNIIRAKDDKKTLRITEEKASDWSACGSRPLEGIHLTLRLTPASGGSESRLAATTDSAGHASFDLSNAHSSSDRAQLVVLAPQGERTSEVSLRGTPMRTTSDAVASKDAWTQARRDVAQQDAADRAAADQAENAKLDRVEAAISKLERTPRWGDEEGALLEQTGKTLLEAYRVPAGGTQFSPRAAGLWARVQKLTQSPAAKQRAADLKRAEAAAAAHAASPQGRCERLCEVGKMQCQAACDTNDSQCRTRCSATETTCEAGCQR